MLRGVMRPHHYRALCNAESPCSLAVSISSLDVADNLSKHGRGCQSVPAVILHRMCFAPLSLGMVVLGDSGKTPVRRRYTRPVRVPGIRTSDWRYQDREACYEGQRDDFGREGWINSRCGRWRGSTRPVGLPCSQGQPASHEWLRVRPVEALHAVDPELHSPGLQDDDDMVRSV